MLLKLISEKENTNSKIKEVAYLFLKLGIIGFGGPAAHIAMMEEEVVRKRKWMDRQHFLDLVGATNLIPGPNSTEMTMHCGRERAGVLGLFVAGICFIMPAAIITIIFAWLYQSYGSLPNVKPFVFGIKPAIIVIIINAAFLLGKKALKSTESVVLCVVTLSACLIGVNEILVLFSIGFIGIFIHLIKDKKAKISCITPFSVALIQGVPLALPSFTFLKIFGIFFKVGALLYGSGYVLFAFLEEELVNKGMLSMQQLIDAIAVGQFTPGPVFTSATFIGWQMNGIEGAVAATLGIFLPSFLLVLVLNPLIPKMRDSKLFGAFLDAVNVAAVAIIISVVIEMGKVSIIDWRSLLILILGMVFIFGFKKTNSALVVIGGAIAGYLLYLL